MENEFVFIMLLSMVGIAKILSMGIIEIVTKSCF